MNASSKQNNGGAAAPATEGREVAPHHDMRAGNAVPCVSFEDLHRPEVTSIHELGNGPGAMHCQPHSLVGLCGGRSREFSLDLSLIPLEGGGLCMREVFGADPPCGVGEPP